MTPLQEMISSHPFLAGTDARFEHLFFDTALFEQYGAERFVFRAGEPANRFYLVHSGRIALESSEPGEEKRIIQTVGAGEALGWSWLFAPYLWHFGARTVGPSEAISLNADYLRQMIADNPAFGRDLVLRISEVLLKRLNATHAQFLKPRDERAKG